MPAGKSLDAVFDEHGFRDFRWTTGTAIKVRQWVRFKCMFGCSSYGKKGTCPPNVPPIEDCREFFSEYDTVAVFRIPKRVDKPEDRIAWSRETNKRLRKMEHDVFMRGYHKAFLLIMDECRLCTPCIGSRENCVNKEDARPSPESLAVDVFETVRDLGFPIEVLQSYEDEMNRYAMLLVE